MLVLVAMRQTQILLALWTPKVIQIQFRFAFPRLAMSSFPIGSNSRDPLIEFALTFSRINVLVPKLSRGYSLTCSSSQAQAGFAERAEYHVVVIVIVVALGALVIDGASVVGAVDYFTEFTLEREEVLLVAEDHVAVGSNISEFH